MKILILEDNSFVLSIIRAALKLYDHQILVAFSVGEATQIYQAWEPNLVISDLHLEEGTSIPFLEVLIADRFNNVLVVSSDAVLLGQVEKELIAPEWRYVNKNDRKWLVGLKEAMDHFLGA